MIETVKGNIFELLKPGDVFVHGCNSLGIMGAGIALKVAARWPQCFTKYHEWHQSHGLDLGNVIYYHDKNSDVVIANAITQEGVGGVRPMSYDAIDICFQKIFATKFDAPRIIFPMIGAGLGGGSWTVIEQIIMEAAKRQMFSGKLVLVKL